MKKTKIIIGFGLLALAGLMACQKEEQVTKNGNAAVSNYGSRISVNKNTVGKNGQLTASGDGYLSRTFQFGDISASCIGIYSAQGNNTYFSMRSEDGSSIAGVFSGNKSGEYAQGSFMTFIHHGKTYESDNQVRIKIREYGAAGSKISGSFSGIFRRYDVDVRSGKRLEFLLNVQNGQFEVIRQDDLSHAAD